MVKYALAYTNAAPRSTVVIFLLMFVTGLIAYQQYGPLVSLIGAMGSLMMTLCLKYVILTLVHEKVFSFRRNVAASIFLITLTLVLSALILLPILSQEVLHNL